MGTSPSQPDTRLASGKAAPYLAPMLYLFIAVELAFWLKECPAIGTEVTPEKRIHCLQ